jgi:hypothetical protein
MDGGKSMKKLFMLAMILVVILFTTISVALAENTVLSKPSSIKTCAVLVANANMKSSDFLTSIDEEFNAGSSVNKIDIGTNIQSLYQNFRSEKGFQEEQTLTQENLYEFVKYSKYDNVLFLMLNNPILGKTQVHKTLIFVTAEQTKASVEVHAFLVDAASTLKEVSATKQDDTTGSEVRAIRGAFKQALKEIHIGLNSPNK